MAEQRAPRFWWFLALAGVWIAIMGHVGDLEAQKAAEAKAQAYNAYVTTAAAESDLKTSAYTHVALGVYKAASEAHSAVVADAEKALEEAHGKVDPFGLSALLAELRVVGSPAFMADADRQLVAGTRTLRDQIAAYDAEQARLAEEARIAAEEAARQAAPEPVYEDPEPYSAPSAPEPSGPDYTLWVYGWGGQDAIDACAGAVWFDGYGGAGLAEHWRCGGSSFPDWAGAVIDIPGVGVYESVGIIAVMDTNGQPASAAPYGYADIFYQTCYDGDPANTIFVGLNRIG